MRRTLGVQVGGGGRGKGFFDVFLEFSFLFLSSAIWFAASEGHNDVLKYLMHKEHDTYSLMEDKRFVFNLMVVSKSHNKRPIEEFILVSPAPVDAAAKLSNIYINLSTKVRG